LELPDPDLVVRVAGVQGLAVGGPGQRQALGLDGGLVRAVGLVGDLELLNGFLVLQVPDLDARAGSGAKPVPVRAEDQSADLFAAVQLVEGVVAVLAEVPEEGLAVLATGGSQGTIGGDGDGVDESGVALEVVLELEVAEVPDLDDLVPTAGDDHGVVGGGGESDGRDPWGGATPKSRKKFATNLLGWVFFVPISRPAHSWWQSLPS